MKKTILLIIIALAFAGCNIHNTRHPKKPFIIYDKAISDWRPSHSGYVYYDADGQTFSFQDLTTSYKIGDTIK